MRIYYTDQIRQYDGAITQMGHSVSPYAELIPPNANSYLQYGECTSSCLTQVMADNSVPNIKVIAGMLHSHLLGIRMKLRHIYQNGTEAAPILRDNNYDFNYQEFRILNQERVILPGQSLQVECDYRTTTRSNFTYGGLGTSQEMCIAYTMYYPKISLSYCETAPVVDHLLYYLNHTDVRYTSFSAYGSLHDIILNHNNKTVLQSLNEMHWNQTNANAFSALMKDIRRSVTCKINGVRHPRVPASEPAISITREYVEPIQTCVEPSSGFQVELMKDVCSVSTRPVPFAAFLFTTFSLVVLTTLFYHDS
uniref:Copper type II ascorbate-dependent monooxygenase C-terminal domain-containing protein n=1 Tax=Ciona savignyi TaxID=51511 RepID=H2ZI51_CIOSA